MDGFITAMGIAKAGEHPANGAETQFDPETPESKEGLEAGIDVCALCQEA
jgi:hypothetical protein